MENKVYYGEYSLRHWINLILAKNIELPAYQRYYVWDAERVRKLYNSLSQKHFVPPVIIGSFNIKDKSYNYIIDGQQRLTSIFLMYLGLFPDKNAYKRKIKQYANENDDEPAIPDMDNILEWRFSQLTDKGDNKHEIVTQVAQEPYKTLDLEIPDDFWDSTYLGFSYIVPDTKSTQDQQKFYSSVFRNINMNGVTLTNQEKRTALYFLDEKLTKFFEPEISNIIHINNSSKTSSNYMDFVRYMSLLSEYTQTGNTNNIASGYSYSMEDYYEQYILSVTGQKESDIFMDFYNIFPQGNYLSRLDQLKDSIKTLDINREFSSIVLMDLYMFGLIYNIVIKGENADNFDKDLLHQHLSEQYKKYQTTDKEDAAGNPYSSHIRNPGRLTFLRQRMADSIQIYEQCKLGN